jgi:hypothetical protein
MCVGGVANTGLPVLTFFLAARGMLNGMHGRRVVAAMVLLHAAELSALLIAVNVTGGLARSHPGRGMGVAMLLLLVATVLVGWQGYRLLAGHRSLNVVGLDPVPARRPLAGTVRHRRIRAGRLSPSACVAAAHPMRGGLQRGAHTVS